MKLPELVGETGRRATRPRASPPLDSRAIFSFGFRQGTHRIEQNPEIVMARDQLSTILRLRREIRRESLIRSDRDAVALGSFPGLTESAANSCDAALSFRRNRACLLGVSLLARELLVIRQHPA